MKAKTDQLINVSHVHRKKLSLTIEKMKFMNRHSQEVVLLPQRLEWLRNQLNISKRHQVNLNLKMTQTKGSQIVALNRGLL